MNIFEIIGLIIGISICILSGSLVGKFRKYAVSNIKLTPPAGVTQKDWDEATGGEGIAEPGKWLGIIERLLIFFAVWINEYTIIAAWLAFKVATKWEVWNNIVKVPDLLPESKDNLSTLCYLKARRAWGAMVLSGFLIGTITNVLIGFVLASGIHYLLK